MEMKTNWLDAVSFNHDGLVPAVAQDYVTGRILMMAWMNKETLATDELDALAAKRACHS